MKTLALSTTLLARPAPALKDISRVHRRRQGEMKGKKEKGERRRKTISLLKSPPYSLHAASGGGGSCHRKGKEKKGGKKEGKGKRGKKAALVYWRPSQISFLASCSGGEQD